MKCIPPELNPTTTRRVVLPSGKVVNLPTCQPNFRLWSGPPPSFTFGGKKILSYQDQPIFAELLVLKLLENRGWNGVWVSFYGGIKYLREMPKESSLAHSRVALFDKQSAFLDRIFMRSHHHGGCFDVFAWRDDEVLFCEAKRKGKDKLHLSQCRWIESAITEGVQLGSLLIVEWSLVRD